MDEVQQLVNRVVGTGFVPIYSKVTLNGAGQPKYDLVFVKPLEIDWEFRRYDEATYETKNREYLAQGFKQLSMQTWQSGGTTWYSGIWHRPKQEAVNP